MENSNLCDGLYAFPLAVQHDSSDHQQGIWQSEMGISWDAPADSNRGSSLQSPTINTVGDDAHIVPAKCISETRKSSANSLVPKGSMWASTPTHNLENYRSKHKKHAAWTHAACFDNDT